MILSVSRRTDIPCCYPQWFMERLRAGFALTRNPVNPSQISKVSLSPGVVDCIVFWTKDPGPLMPYLDELDSMGYRYYFQFTLTPYGRDLEPGLRERLERIKTFLALSNRLGAHRVLWRYDPILLDENHTAAWHQAQFATLCHTLKGAAGRVTISFLDLYPRLRRAGFRVITEAEAFPLATALAAAAAEHGLSICSCAEPWDLTPCGISPGACIDYELIRRLCGCELDLPPDKNQRPACLCRESVDIGSYDTCTNGCAYCYADHGRTARPVYDPHSPLLCGELLPAETVRERECRSLLNPQLKLY